VLGSAAGAPGSGAPEIAREIAALGGPAYHQIILGFRAENGRRRWLSDAEISEGVLDAMERGDDVTVVGEV
jgi:hypothetical protein